jgi:hypothetical protein
MEYESFHYLMHKQPEAVRPTYVSGPSPLAFAELYSPRGNVPIHMLTTVKSFWRTRDEVSFHFFELRSKCMIVICCSDRKTAVPYRTIVVSLEKLYGELEAKARETRDPLFKKKEKKLTEDAVLYKAACDYLLARLNIVADPKPWPRSQPVKCSTDNTASAVQEIVCEAEVALERMVTLDKLSSDTFYDTLEIPCELLNSVGDLGPIDRQLLKLAPSETVSPSSTSTDNVSIIVANSTAPVKMEASDNSSSSALLPVEKSKTPAGMEKDDASASVSAATVSAGASAAGITEHGAREAGKPATTKKPALVAHSVSKAAATKQNPRKVSPSG